MPEAARSALCVNNKLKKIWGERKGQKRELQQTMNTNEHFRNGHKWWIAQCFRGFDDCITVIHNFHSMQKHGLGTDIKKLLRVWKYMLCFYEFIPAWLCWDTLYFSECRCLVFISKHCTMHAQCMPLSFESNIFYVQLCSSLGTGKQE